jgi:hypothetical protein
MSVNALAFVFGAFLVLTAIVGGGFEIKELKVPKVGWLPRFAATIAGVAFILLGIGMTVQSTSSAQARDVPDASPAPVVHHRAAAKPVDVIVGDELLASIGIDEHVSVWIDGKIAGTLGVDAVHQDAVIRVSLTPGLHSYSLESDSGFDLDGSAVNVQGDGQGQIDVARGKVFVVHRTLRDRTLGLSLVEGSAGGSA